MTNIAPSSSAVTAGRVATEAPPSAAELAQKRTPEQAQTRSVEKTTNETPQLTVQEMEETVQAMNEMMKSLSRGLNFQVDDDNGRTIIKVIDRETQDLIKQFPSEELVKLITSMQNMQNILFDDQA